MISYFIYILYNYGYNISSSASHLQVYTVYLNWIIMFSLEAPISTSRMHTYCTKFANVQVISEIVCDLRQQSVVQQRSGSCQISMVNYLFRVFFVCTLLHDHQVTHIVSLYADCDTSWRTSLYFLPLEFTMHHLVLSNSMSLLAIQTMYLQTLLLS